MAGVLDSVNQRTQLVGQNRLELLLFRLDGNQLYGINVFKVKEVLQCPRLTVMPKSSPVVRGVANIRGGTIPILDLALATGRRGLQDLTNSFAIITEYNTKVQGFLVRSVERIVNMNWEEIHPPPKGAGREHYLTAVTRVDKQLVEIIDVEKVLAEVAPTSEEVSHGVVDAETQSRAVTKRVLVVDDSSVARKQVTRCLEAVGVEMTALNDGRQALEYLQNMLAEGRRPEDELLMLIRDNSRIILCGSISSYNDLNSSKPDVYKLKNYSRLVIKRALMKGFLYFDYHKEFPQALAEIAALVKQGKMKYKVDMRVGVEECGRGLADLLQGKNTGKVIIRVDDTAKARL